MRFIKKKTKQKLIKTPIIWLCIERLIPKKSKRYRKLKKLYNWSEAEELARKDYEKISRQKQAILISRLESQFQDNTVRHGPFKGMKYPQKVSSGSELYPKLLGSYEAELSNVISYVIQQKYATVLDIGCAEGYYAVGIGMKIPTAQIIAYDTDIKALELCQQMADLNKVKVQTKGFCTEATIRSLNLTDKSLIISDCEGFENKVFTESLCKDLKNHDLLIECHDFIDINTTPRLIKRLSGTHTIEIIKSIDDIDKAYNYSYAELDEYTLDERKKILAERRPSIMRWIFAKANN